MCGSNFTQYWNAWLLLLAQYFWVQQAYWPHNFRHGSAMTIGFSFPETETRNIGIQWSSMCHLGAAVKAAHFSFCVSPSWDSELPGELRGRRLWDISVFQQQFLRNPRAAPNLSHTAAQCWALRLSGGGWWGGRLFSYTWERLGVVFLHLFRIFFVVLIAIWKESRLNKEQCRTLQSNQLGISLSVHERDANPQVSSMNRRSPSQCSDSVVGRLYSKTEAVTHVRDHLWDWRCSVGATRDWFFPLFCSSQGKSYVKDALRCMALGLRQRFSCVSRRCSAVKEMVFSLQRECYSKHQLCLALQDHMDTMGSLIQFHLMFPPGWGEYTSTNVFTLTMRPFFPRTNISLNLYYHYYTTVT